MVWRIAIDDGRMDLVAVPRLTRYIESLSLQGDGRRFSGRLAIESNDEGWSVD